MSVKKLYSVISSHIAAKIIIQAAVWRLDEILLKCDLDLNDFSSTNAYSFPAIIRLFRALENYDIVFFIDKTIVRHGKCCEFLSHFRSPHFYNINRMTDHLEHSLTTNQECYSQAFGASFYEHVQDSAKYSAELVEWQSISSRLFFSFLLKEYHFDPSIHLIELGGNGTFLLQCLKENLVAEGTLFSNSKPKFKNKGTQFRFIQGNIFYDNLPIHGDLYLFCRVLLNYTDTELKQLFFHWQKIMKPKPKSKLIIVEYILPDKNHPDYQLSTLADLNILICLGGALRTKEEWVKIVSAAGFNIVSIRITEPNNQAESILPICIIEINA